MTNNLTPQGSRRAAARRWHREADMMRDVDSDASVLSAAQVHAMRRDGDYAARRARRAIFVLTRPASMPIRQ